MISDAVVSKSNEWKDDFKKSSDIFDTSKDKIKNAQTTEKQTKKPEDKPGKKGAFEIQADDEEPEMTEEAQQRAIEEQF